MANENELNLDVFASIDSILSATKLDDVSSESAGNNELPDGYYLCEVDKANLTTSKTSGKPQVAFQMTIVEDGVSADIDEVGKVIKTPLEHTKNRKIFLYYPLVDERSVKRFASDMLKFEDPDVEGEPILSKECFTNSAVLTDALSILVGLRIYVNASTSKNKQGEPVQWKNLVSWKRIDALEL